MSHTVYRPADLSGFTGARRLPIVAWGNGACSNAGLLFQTFLKQIASHGFVVIASGPKDAPLPAFASQRARPGRPSRPNPNGRHRGGRTTKDAGSASPPSTGRSPRTAASGSPYQGQLNPDEGRGDGAVVRRPAGDRRRRRSAHQDRGHLEQRRLSRRRRAAPAPRLSGATKARSRKFHAPVAYFLGGPTDVAYANGKDDFSRVTTVPAFLGSINSGHGGTYNQPGGGWFGEVGVAWLNWRLNGDKDGREVLRRRRLHAVQEPDLGSREEEPEVGSRFPPASRTVLASRRSRGAVRCGVLQS